MSNSRITHPSSGSITPEEARDARARAWKFVFDRYREKADKTDGGEDARTETRK